MLEQAGYILSDIEWLLKLFIRFFMVLNAGLILYLIYKRLVKKPKV